MTGWLLRILIPLIGFSLRWRVEDLPGLLADTPRQPVIFAFWHNRIFLMPYLFRKHWHNRRRGQPAVLVSASRDGEKLVRVLRHFHIICVRGSTSRRGREALRELTRLVREGHDIGITPDGPLGPKYRVQDGVAQLAQLTGTPIVPVSYLLSRKITLKSWDAFMIPVPFARATLRVGHPITVPREADDALRQTRRQELERALQELSDVTADEPPR